MPLSAPTCWSCQSLGNPHAGLLRCMHGFCTHARYGDVLRPPFECYMCIANPGNWYFESTSLVINILSIKQNYRLQDDPIQSQEHTVYNDQISSDGQSRDVHPLPDSQNSTYILSQAQRQTDVTPLVSCGPISNSKKPLEIKFHHSANDRVHQERPRRRGPLKEGSRDEMKRLRTNGGACWRCKVLRKQVRVQYDYVNAI